MADLPSVKAKIQDTEVFRDAELTTALHRKFGSSINYLLDTAADQRARTDSQNNSSVSRGAKAVNFSTYYRQLTGGTYTVVDNQITPGSNKVWVVMQGQIERRNLNSAMTITLRRNATPIRTVVVNEKNTTIYTEDLTPGSIGVPPVPGSTFSQVFNLSYLNIIDDGASPGVLNTYDLIIDNTTVGVPPIYAYDCAIHLIGRQ